MTHQIHEKGYSMIRLVDLMRQLRQPGGCPWDREQSFESLRKYILEEAYELVDAISQGDIKDIIEEAGDLILQPVFISAIADEQGLFDIDDVIDTINAKLVRRHPHVFGDKIASTSATVLKNWEKIKLQEKERSKAEDQSVLAGVPKNLPALTKAFRIQEKAANVGFDWNKTDYSSVFSKVREEVRELEEEVSEGSVSGKEEEIGDLFFAVVNLARHLDIDPEVALHNASTKFSSRFRKIETNVANQNRTWDSCSLDELDKMWENTKISE